MKNYTLPHLYARALSERLLVASWTADRDYHVEQARKKLIMLLYGGNPADTQVARSEVLDLIETAIVDATDLDTTPAMQAEAVLNALIDSVVPDHGAVAV